MNYLVNAILIDGPSKDGWSHMVCEDISVLHAFAESIELKRCWFQNKRGKKQPHYDVSSTKFQQAIDSGAIHVSRRELFLFLKNKFK